MVFKDKKVGDFFNEHFVNLRLTSGKDEEPELRKRFNVPGYPTVILFTSEGKEIDRIIGTQGGKEKFFSTVVDFSEGKNTIHSFLTSYQADSNNIDLNYKIAMKYCDRFEQQKAQKYFDKTLALDPDNSKGYEKECNFKKVIFTAQYQENVKPLTTFLENCKEKDYLNQGYSALIRSYRNSKNFDKVIETYETAMKAIPESTNLMNGIAWFIYEEKLEKHYKLGIAKAQKAVRLEPDADSIWDTLGWLYYVNGDYKQAVEAMEKALQLDCQSKYYRENVKKFKKKLS